jgi:UDP-sugar transporter A1/2/3
VGLPALLYSIQNILQHYAASHLSATSFMITLQLKLMSAAIFSVILLRRRLTVQ